MEATRGLGAQGSRGAVFSLEVVESGRKGQGSWESGHCWSWVRRASLEMLLTSYGIPSWGSPARTGGCLHKDGPSPCSPSAARTNLPPDSPKIVVAA